MHEMRAVRSTMTTLSPSMPRKYSMWTRPNQETLFTSIQEPFSTNCIPAAARSNRVKMMTARIT